MQAHSAVPTLNCKKVNKIKKEKGGVILNVSRETREKSISAGGKNL